MTRQRTIATVTEANAAVAPPAAEPPRTELIDTHHTRAELRMVAQSARHSWMKGTRWPTDATDQDFIETRKERPLTVKERAALAALKGLQSDDARVSAAAVKSVVAMEAQNQADELKQPRRRKEKRSNVADVGVGVGIGLGLLGGSIEDAKRQIAARIARLIGGGEDAGGNRAIIAEAGGDRSGTLGG